MKYWAILHDGPQDDYFFWEIKDKARFDINNERNGGHIIVVESDEDLEGKRATRNGDVVCPS